ncbi:MAG: type I secretion C-terminal target domain-containing protein, partial [Cyanobacteria bacterium P01_A01_bin.83]
RILDFELNSDRLDVSELLKLSDYISGDPVRDGYITVVSLTEDSLEVQFDDDGIGGKSGNILAILENIDFLAFERELPNQFIFMPTEF